MHITSHTWYARRTSHEAAIVDAGVIVVFRLPGPRRPNPTRPPLRTGQLPERRASLIIEAVLGAFPEVPHILNIILESLLLRHHTFKSSVKKDKLEF